MSVKLKSVPASTEKVLSPKTETVDSAPQHGCVLEAAPVFDAGKDSGVGHFEGDCYDIKFVK